MKTIREAENLICPFMSSAEYQRGEEGTVYNEMPCITTRCMAWVTTKTDRIEQKWFPIEEVEWDDDFCEYRDKTKTWGNDESETLSCKTEQLLYKKVKLSRKDYEGFCQRLLSC